MFALLNCLLYTAFSPVIQISLFRQVTYHYASNELWSTLYRSPFSNYQMLLIGNKRVRLLLNPLLLLYILALLLQPSPQPVTFPKMDPVFVLPIYSLLLEQLMQMMPREFR